MWLFFIYHIGFLIQKFHCNQTLKNSPIYRQLSTADTGLKYIFERGQDWQQNDVSDI